MNKKHYYPAKAELQNCEPQRCPRALAHPCAKTKNHSGVSSLFKDKYEEVPEKRVFIARDGGFTSVGVAVALLLAVTLLFSAAQVRWIQSHSADIQFVADAGALAGANVVGEYMVIARVADAVVLSLSILGMASYGIAIVVSCIPYMQSVGAEIMSFGMKVFEAREKCARTAASSLNTLQAALPFLIAANAAQVIEANGDSSASHASYHGIAIPLPLEGEDVSFPDTEGAAESNSELSEQNSKTSELTDAAEQARKKMESSKLRAYLADCGNNPGRCMYERAQTLAGLSGAQNPYFSSEDSWLFDYAYDRAEGYYKKRLQIEKPTSGSLDDQIRSFCRERFYSFAVEEFKRGWCRTSPDGALDAHFPLLPKNTDEVRESALYTEVVYPLSSDGALHGAPACSAYQAAGAGGFGSVADLERGVHSTCAVCGFAASTIGKVASASTAIDNGFEHHYREVAEAAREYQSAARDYQRESEEAKRSAEESFDIFSEAMNVLKTPRITPHPPGHNGVIVFVFDARSHAIPSGFSNPTVTSNAELAPRTALSAAALAEEKAHSEANILSSFLDKAKAEMESGQSSLALGSLEAFDGILEIWGSALMVYSQGGDAISEGLTAFLEGIPLVKSTPLSQWAKNALSDTIEALGLEGADLDTPKPLLVNSMHVVRASDSAPALALVRAKETYASYSGSGSGTIAGSLVDGFTGALRDRGSELLESELVLFEISFGDASGLPHIPIKLRLPQGALERGQTALNTATGTLNTSLGGGNGTVWE